MLDTTQKRIILKKYLRLHINNENFSLSLHNNLLYYGRYKQIESSSCRKKEDKQVVGRTDGSKSHNCLKMVYQLFTARPCQSFKNGRYIESGY